MAKAFHVCTTLNDVPNSNLGTRSLASKNFYNAICAAQGNNKPANLFIAPQNIVLSDVTATADEALKGMLRQQQGLC